MSEEEKQAIEFLKHSIFEYEEIDTSVLEYIDKNHKIIYKLILKQQKEIENYQILKDDIEEHNIAYVDTPEFEENYISKDKIKKNKNDLYLVNINAQRHSAMQLILEELLGE